MSSSLRDAARDAFCDVLLQVGPTAPTLCEGWDAHRLAAHVWSLSYDPLAWAGMIVHPLNAFTERRLTRIVERWPYVELVARLRRMEGFTCMPWDGRQGHRHGLGEYVIHTEDLRRANDLPSVDPAPELAEALWLRLQVASRQLYGGRRRGLVLAGTNPPRESYVACRGQGSVVTGPVLELLMWVYGRRDSAKVTITPAPLQSGVGAT